MMRRALCALCTLCSKIRTLPVCSARTVHNTNTGDLLRKGRDFCKKHGAHIKRDFCIKCGVHIERVFCIKRDFYKWQTFGFERNFCKKRGAHSKRDFCIERDFFSIRFRTSHAFLLMMLVMFGISAVSFPVYAQTEKPDALKLYNRGDFENAIRVCKDEIDADKTNIDSYVVLCWSLLERRQYREADYWAAEGRAVSVYDHRLIEIQGETQYYLGNNDASLAYFQEYISLVPRNGSRLATAYYFMGEIYIRKALFNHADISLTTAVRYEQLNDVWWARLGYAREMAQSYRDAFLAYEEALSINPTQSDALKGKERIAPKLN